MEGLYITLMQEKETESLRPSVWGALALPPGWEAVNLTFASAQGMLGVIFGQNDG